MNVVMNELKTLSNFNHEKKLISHEILSKLEQIKKEKEKEVQSKIKFPIKINGRIIMEILNLEEGPNIGKILELIRENIRAGKLINEKNEIISFISDLDLSIFNNEKIP